MKTIILWLDFTLSFLIKSSKTKLERLSIPILEPSEKIGKSSYQKEQMLALFCKLVVAVLD